jgi:NADPH:quinone reductase-like Zn-dependent oxidoreductase
VRAIAFDQHGGLDVLRLMELPDPEPGPGQVRVALKAAALNRVDLWTRAGWPGLKLALPHIPGADGAGTVDRLGEGVAAPPVGTPVVINGNLGCGECPACLAGRDNLCRTWNLLGETVRGTYAQYVVVPATNVLPLPSGYDAHAAAAASLVFLTAWHSLVSRGSLQPGEKVLIVGASGGVNTASIQIAKWLGAEVFVVGSSREKLELAESLGADHLIDRSQAENWSKAVYEAAGRQGMDVIVDNVGDGSLPLSLRAAAKGGRILTVGNTGGPAIEIDNRFIFGRHLSILGSTMGTQSDFRQVMQLVFEGKLRPVIDRTYPLGEAAQAQRRLEAGEQLGKLTLAIV